MGKKVFVSLLDNIWGGVTVVLSVICGISFLTFSVHPSQEVFFQWIGLLLPVLILINAALLLYWIIRKKRWLWFPLVALLANFWYYPTVLRLPFCFTDTEKSSKNIVIATFNVHYLLKFGYGNSLYNIADLVDEKRIDVLCMQEIPMNLSKDSLLKVFPSMSEVIVSGSPDDAYGLMVLSRFPVSDYKIISFDERPKCVIKVDVNAYGKHFSVFNCHLQTTNWNQRNLIQTDKVEPQDRISSLLGQKEVMENNFVLRAYQADTIGDMIKKSSVPVIVCGDFNDTPNSYVYYRVKGDLADSFCTSGKGYSYTYKYIGKILRIDYMFYSSTAFDGKKYESPNLNYSDHNPVIVTLGVTD